MSGEDLINLAKPVVRMSGEDLNNFAVPVVGMFAADLVDLWTLEV